jgi:hypothetical protein
MFCRVAVAQVLALAFASAADQIEPRLVDLSVVAVDSGGQPVTDLAREEFQVVDAGKRQQIAFFRHNDGKLPQIPTLGSGEVSNGGRANAPHVTMVLFDLLNQRFYTRALTANQIVQELGDVEAADGLVPLSAHSERPVIRSAWSKWLGEWGPRPVQFRGHGELNF